MDDFKDSTKTHYACGGQAYAKGGAVKGAAKISKVMGEFKSGKLHSGSKSGPEVTNPKQAVAIALSEARKAPVKKNTGGRISMAELEQSNRDVGGMSKKAVEAAGEAIASGNRMAVEEGKESRLVGRKATPRSREVTVENTRQYSRAEPEGPQSALSRRLSTLPSQRGEMRRGPAGAGFSVAPLVSAARDALGLKKGGLATMPRGKKC